MLKKAFFDRIIITQPSGFVKERKQNSTYYINISDAYCEKYTKTGKRVDWIVRQSLNARNKATD